MEKREIKYLIDNVYKEARAIEIGVNRGKINLKEATQSSLLLVAKLAMVLNEITKKEEK